MYLGARVLEELKRPEVANKPDAIKDFFIRCRNFMAKLCAEIQKRFDFDDPLLKLLPLLHLSTALSIREHSNNQSLMKLSDTSQGPNLKI